MTRLPRLIERAMHMYDIGTSLLQVGHEWKIPEAHLAPGGLLLAEIERIEQAGGVVTSVKPANNDTTDRVIIGAHFFFEAPRSEEAR